MTAARKDFIVEKGARFYKELALVDNNGSAVTLVGKTIQCVIKESNETDTVLFNLTEANSGIQVLDDANGSVALYITADNTDINVDFGVYKITQIDENYPDEEIERLLEGKIEFIK